MYRPVGRAGRHVARGHELVRRPRPPREPHADEATLRAEALVQKLGLRVAFPPAKLRQHLDSKVTTTHLANRAGIPSVPNVLARVDSYATLRRVAHALGPDLVVQMPYGDSSSS